MDKEKRKKITQFIVTAINDIIPDGKNSVLTKDFLESLSDNDFIDYIKKLGTEEKRLAVIVPNNSKPNLNLENNFKVAKKYDIELFHRIWLEKPDGRGKYLSNDKYLILKLPVRRQQQLLLKKISIPENNKTIDNLTGQPAGDSKGSKISYPEVQMLASLGLDKSLNEFMHFRGGDLQGFNVMNTIIQRTGGVSLDAIRPYSGEVESTKALSVFLSGMHLKNNL